jgi:hypothetical protein
MMKLSEAIRLGSLLRPQGFRYLFDNHGRTCALGAALDAIRKLPDFLSDRYIPEEWINFINYHSQCPACPFVGNVITHLNDFHKWTRESIADWIESIESNRDESNRIEMTALITSR